jgi:hypothetical protein
MSLSGAISGGIGSSTGCPGNTLPGGGSCGGRFSGGWLVAAVNQDDIGDSQQWLSSR